MGVVVVLMAFVPLAAMICSAGDGSGPPLHLKAWSTHVEHTENAYISLDEETCYVPDPSHNLYIDSDRDSDRGSDSESDSDGECPFKTTYKGWAGIVERCDVIDFIYDNTLFYPVPLKDAYNELRRNNPCQLDWWVCVDADHMKVSVFSSCNHRTIPSCSRHYRSILSCNHSIMHPFYHAAIFL